MIESTVLATGGCFLTLTVTVSVDLVADHVVDPADHVDLVVDLKYLVLRSVEAFLLFTISVLCDVNVECLDCNVCLGSTIDHCLCNLCASKCLDECNFCLCSSSGNLCFSFSSDNCVLFISFYAVDLWSVACRLPCRSITCCPCRFACRCAMCKPCRFACRSACRFDHSASTA